MDNHAVPIDSRAKGQTLAEFAITLPILLLLLFGIIEFGRLFQSWVTIQNASRAAARYTVTGQFDERRYSMDMIPCTTTRENLNVGVHEERLWTPANFDVVSFQQQVGLETFARLYRYENGQLFIRVPVFEDSGVAGSEFLYRTWYGERDCFPDPNSDQDRRDMLRLPSIYDQARIGAAGLALDPSQTNLRDGETPAQMLQRFLYTQYASPSPGLDNPAFFTVTVCSARARRFSSDFTAILNNPDDPTGSRLRYHTATDTNQFAFAQGACILRERPLPNVTEVLDQYGVPTMDAGGAGERVTIIVTYNHPLITPLPLGRFVRLQSTRAAVNESFRVTNAERALGPSGFQGPPFLSPTPIPPTNTPTATMTASATHTASATSTSTFTPTPSPFACEKITLQPIALVDNRLIVRFLNQNDIPTYITGARLVWANTPAQQAFPSMRVTMFTLNLQIFWRGNDPQSDTDTRSAAVYPAGDINSPQGVVYIGPSNRFWVEPSPTGTENDPTVFEATFTDGPTRLSQWYQGWEFSGSEFYFHNPLGTECRVAFVTPPPPPTATPPPVNFTPSPTFTPDCASSTLQVAFERFDPFGDVVLRVTNNRAIIAPFLGFELVWPAWRSAGLTLESVVVSTNGGINASIPGTGTTVWQSNASGGYRPPSVVVGNPNPPTVTSAYDTSAGVWRDNGDPFRVAYTFDPGPNSVTFIYINFSGVGAVRLDAIGVAPSDFNGTRFFIECGRNNLTPGGPGGGGGGGPSGSQGQIFLNVNPTPPPTQPPRPTNTPGPTPTFTRTFTPGPPTNTFTPAPPTSTASPVPTQGPTNTPRPTSTPTNVSQDCPTGNCG